ncbi:peptide/nickel transport system permease protein [Blastococcus sp. DSM 46786]|uniref:ABC transporter permease n=1 Tax=Blastococcus sp. DSM 46786 TaxID=1798227 RepID=UPI0008CD624F|nr:ABC transporter permease [Blastococcus sp. DSM 46786]SEK70882.1 peptide/nickel transport system permease protein [Blastococcus sp. DSM 46786]
MSEMTQVSTPPAYGQAVDAAVAPAPMQDPRRSRSLWAGVVLTALGIVTVAIGVAGLRGANGWLQLAVVVAGLALTHVGAGRLLRHRFGAGFDLTSWLSAIWLVLLVLAALLAPVLPLGEHEDIASTLSAPVFARPDLLSEYPLGTNNFGLDLLARVLYGARASLVVALGAVAMGLVIGAALGIVSGFFRKTTDAVIGIFTNSLLAVPPLILLIALATVLEPSLRNLAFALSLLALPSIVRMARASTLTFVQREFVLAARAMGASRLRIMTRELLPNVMLPLLSYAMVMISVLIVAEASLSFLGLGIQPPDPSWGNMIAEGEGNAFEEHPHIVLVPGVVLFLTVFSLNLLGEKARKRFDPRQAKL